MSELWDRRPLAPVAALACILTAFVVVVSAAVPAVARIRTNENGIPVQPDYVELSPRLQLGRLGLVDLSHSIRPGVPTFFGPWGNRDQLPTPGLYENLRLWSPDYVNRIFSLENVGTQIDAPAHFVDPAKRAGTWSAAQIPANRLFGVAVVVDLTDVIDFEADPNHAITADEIRAWESTTGIAIREDWIVLVRTGWDRFWNSFVAGGDPTFSAAFPGLHESAAQLFVSRGIKGWGIDTTSQDPAPSEEFPVHITMGEHNVWALEDLDDLGELPPIVFLAVGSTKLAGASGGPARVWALFDRAAPLEFATALAAQLEELAIVDLTHTLEVGIPTDSGPWKGFFNGFTYDQGFLLSGFDLTEHTGTHIEAPAHVVRGAAYVDQIDIASLFGPGIIVDVRDAVAARGPTAALTADDFRAWEQATGRTIGRGTIVLVRTGWGEKWDDYLAGDLSYAAGHPGLDPSAARFLASRGVHGVGIDTLDIEPTGAAGFAATRVLATAGIWILENVDGLDFRAPGPTQLLVLPWMLWHGSGAPVRVFAFVAP